MGQQGVNVQYGSEQGLVDRGQISYGTADVDTLEAQVAALEDKVPVFTAVLERAAGSWTATSINGPASLTSVTEGANSVTVLWTLSEAIGHIARLPRAIDYFPNSVSDTRQTRTIAQALTASEVGDSVNAGVTVIRDEAGVLAAPADGDRMTIAVWRAVA